MYLLCCSDGDGDGTERYCGIIKDLALLHCKPNLRTIVRQKDDRFVTLAKLEQQIPEKRERESKGKEEKERPK